MNAYVIDIESDKLYPYQKNIWVIVIKQVGVDRILKLYPFREQNVKQRILDFIFIESNPLICGHNFLGFDGWVLWKDLDMEFHLEPSTFCGRSVEYHDTLYSSQYTLPDRIGGHSLKNWGIIYNDNKIDYYNVALELGVIQKGAEKGSEFLYYTDAMVDYCTKDVLITEQIYLQLSKQIKDEGTENAFKWGQKGFWLMYAQSFTGFKFDIEKAKILKIQIEQMILELKAEVEPDLPPRQLKEAEKPFYTFPAKIFKKSGSLTSHMVNFINHHQAQLTSNDTLIISGEEYEMIPKFTLPAHKPMNLEDQNALKDFFLENGWEPTFYNYKKNDKGKVIRDSRNQLIPTSPKIQENGKICPNLLELQGDLPSKIVKFLSLRNRLGVLTGWLENPRLQYDGRISGGASGIASTHRQKHVTIVNTPKAEEGVLLGKEFRDLWKADENNILIGCDAAALENRIEAHWVYKYDNGVTAEEILSGDPHSKNAKAFYPEETKQFDIKSPNFDKDLPTFRPYRSKSKNGKYCLPLSTEILTSNGWKKYNEINLQDIVYSLDTEFNEIKEDVILEKHFNYNQEVFEWSNKENSFQCTEDHRWYGWIRKWGKITRTKQWGFFESNEITQEHNILVSSIFNTPKNHVTCLEAELLGYILSDGSYTWSSKNKITSSSYGTKKAVKCTIAQSITKFHKEIRQCIIDNNILFNEYRKLSKNGDIIVFDLKPNDARNFLDKVVGIRKNKHEINWCKWVLNLSQESRQSFINGFWRGDGESKKAYNLNISQNEGNILDAIYLAMYTLGNKVSIKNKTTSKTGFKNKGTCRIMKRLNKSHITCQELTKKSLGIRDTFCLTTSRGSFVIKQNNQIMLTGNCITYGGSGAKLAKTLGQSEDRGIELFDAFWKANPALKSLKDEIEEFWKEKGNKKWIPTIDGRRVNSRSQHSLVNLLFQSSGAIMMDYALLLFHNQMGKFYLDNLGRPYYIYKNYIIKRVLYVHDEWIVECREEVSKEIAHIMEKCIEKAGVILKLKIPSKGEAKIGLTWKNTH